MLLQARQREAKLIERHTRRRAAAALFSSLRAWNDLTQLRRQRRMALLRFINKTMHKRKREAFSRCEGESCCFQSQSIAQPPSQLLAGSTMVCNAYNVSSRCQDLLLIC